MKHKLLWAGLILAGVVVIALAAWRQGILSELYRSYVPAGEISAAQVRGINNIGFPEKDPAEFDFFVAGHIYGSQEIKDRSRTVCSLRCHLSNFSGLPRVAGDMVTKQPGGIRAAEHVPFRSHFPSQHGGNHDARPVTL
jgi:hypothetical protein